MAKFDAVVLEIVTRIRNAPNQTTDSIRAIRREFSKQMAAAEPSKILRIADALLDQHESIHRWVAYELVCHHPTALRSLGAKEVERLGLGMASWPEVDSFACDIAGRGWRNQQVSDRLIHRWAASPDRWWRRAALVATVPLNNKTQGGIGDIKRTLAVCRLLKTDRDDMVVKALSWALRELAKRAPAAVSQFLVIEAVALSPRVLREVRDKLTTGLKNPGPIK